MNHIVDFQKNNNLIADGIVGKNTIQKMRCVFDIKTDAQMAHFLANIHHETGGFKADTENLNYSASGLLSVFPKYFNETTANLYNRQPERIANRVYAGRMGNAKDEYVGDGWKYRGRGALQLTGKDNYKAFADFVKDVSVVSNPDIVATKYYWQSALFYFTRNNLWNLMKGNDPATVKAVRKAVNGGYNGLQDTQEKFVHYYNLITK